MRRDGDVCEPARRVADVPIGQGSGCDLGPRLVLPATTTVTGLQIRTFTHPGARPKGCRNAYCRYVCRALPQPSRATAPIRRMRPDHRSGERVAPADG